MRISVIVVHIVVIFVTVFALTFLFYKSTRVVQQRIYTDIEEDTVYLQLLLITVASLVLVVFVVSIIFSCWWIKSRQENLDPGKCLHISPFSMYHILTSLPSFFAADYHITCLKRLHICETCIERDY